MREIRGEDAHVVRAEGDVYNRPHEERKCPKATAVQRNDAYSRVTNKNTEGRLQRDGDGGKVIEKEAADGGVAETGLDTNVPVG